MSTIPIILLCNILYSGRRDFLAGSKPDCQRNWCIDALADAHSVEPSTASRGQPEAVFKHR
ncbi:MAG: hypothetical protein KDJ64_04735, partial [Nitratireductor sp.]|nr:hypothetical protein [Nitratireductor sp.]